MNPWIHKWQMFPSSVWASCRGRRQPDSTRLPSVGRIMNLFATSPVQQQPVTKDFKKETKKYISLGDHIRTLLSTVMALLWFWRHNTGVKTYLLTILPSFSATICQMLSMFVCLEERYSSPSGSGRSPAAKRILVQSTAQNLQICLSFTHVHKTFMQHFYDFFLECRFCPCCKLIQ